MFGLFLYSLKFKLKSVLDFPFILFTDVFVHIIMLHHQQRKVHYHKNTQRNFFIVNNLIVERIKHCMGTCKVSHSRAQLHIHIVIKC